jgi:hypothetical protein
VNRVLAALIAVTIAIGSIFLALHRDVRPTTSASTIQTADVTPLLDRKEEFAARASRSRTTVSPQVIHSPRALKKPVIHKPVHKAVRRVVADDGSCGNWRSTLGADEAWIYERESGMDPTPADVNPRSGARGLGQLLESTYRDLGIVPDWNPCHERDAARAYMRQPYDSWSRARAFWESHRWWKVEQPACHADHSFESSYVRVVGTTRRVLMGRQSQYKTKRDDVLAAIKKLTAEQGRSPSLREVSGETGVSIATLHSYMAKLKEEGAIEWQEKSHRSIRIKTAAPPTPFSPFPQQPVPLPPPPTAPPQPVATPSQDIDPGF